MILLTPAPTVPRALPSSVAGGLCGRLRQNANFVQVPRAKAQGICAGSSPHKIASFVQSLLCGSTVGSSNRPQGFALFGCPRPWGSLSLHFHHRRKCYQGRFSAGQLTRGSGSALCGSVGFAVAPLFSRCVSLFVSSPPRPKR